MMRPHRVVSAGLNPGSVPSGGQTLGDRYSGKVASENVGVGSAHSRDGST